MDDLIALTSGDLLGVVFMVLAMVALIAWLWKDLRK